MVDVNIGPFKDERGADMVTKTLPVAILLLLVGCGLCLDRLFAQGIDARQAPRDDAVVARVASPLIDTDRQLPNNQDAPDFDRDARFADLARMADAFELRNAIVRQVTELVRPSVVHIEAQKRSVVDNPTIDRTDNVLAKENLIEEAGSGVIVQYGSELVVVTNRHVIHNAPARRIRICLYDGRSIHPTRILSDASTDVAILGIDLPDVIPARTCDSDSLGVGDFVLAFGSPFGLSHSVTQGIVSAKGRRDLVVGAARVRIQDFIQTDAAINPGNSGGPLVNLRGEVVGINTAIASDSGVNAGIGFAMPVNIAMFIGRQLVETGEVQTAYLGVKLQSDFDRLDAHQAGLPTAAGARISHVSQGSPAEVAGLQIGDIVYQFNGRTVDNDSHLVQLVGLTSAGSEVRLVVYRQQNPITVVVVLRTRR